MWEEDGSSKVLAECDLDLDNDWRTETISCNTNGRRTEVRLTTVETGTRGLGPEWKERRRRRIDDWKEDDGESCREYRERQLCLREACLT